MLTLTPVSLAAANTFVAEHHRHHKPVTGHKFSIGCTADGQLVGVAIVGRPVSRYLDDGQTEAPVCNCTEKCVAGSVNTACPVCSVNMSECAGVEAEPEPEETEQPQEEEKGGGMGILLVVLLLAAAGGGAFYYFKIMKPKKDAAKGSSSLDDLDFDEDDEETEEVETEQEDKE